MMRILDINGIEISDPDYEAGYTVEEVVVTAHHDAAEAVEERWHYEVVAEYPNGSREMAKVVDVPGSPAQDAWDETEEILRWIPYSAEELAQRQAERLAREAEERAAAEDAAALERENARLRAQVSALMDAQQFLEDCLAEMAEIVYA